MPRKIPTPSATNMSIEKNDTNVFLMLANSSVI